MKLSNVKNIHSGRSMVEILGVLGIMAMITALGIIAYTQAIRMFKVNQVRADVQVIRTRVIEMSRGDYSDWVGGKALGNQKSFKKNFVDTDFMRAANGFGGISGTYGGGYWIGGNKVYTTLQKNQYVIAPYAIKSLADCEALKSLDWPGSLDVDNIGPYPHKKCIYSSANNNYSFLILYQD